MKHNGLTWKKRSNVYSVLRAARSYLGKARFGEPEYHMLASWVSEGAVVADIGANVGVYTFRLAKLVGASGRVLTVEPLPFHAKRIRRTARWLRLRQVEVTQAALGGAAGPCGISVPPLSTKLVDDGQSHIATSGESTTHEVDMVRLDTLIENTQRLDFIKIDVEGAECDVIEGGERGLAKFKPIILCESQDLHAQRYGHTAQDLFDKLAVLGYRPHIVCDGTVRRLRVPEPSAINYLFLPSKD